ncbi:MAG TPA: hypothetical protein VHD35_04430 [Chitinophagaceae bacterium]|nr:hypothetical protein [Chitinophagaceae bacterium]
MATPLSLRNSSCIFAIPLGRDDYFLTREALHASVDSGLLKKRGWHFPQLKFISFRRGRIRIKNSYEGVSYDLTVIAERDKLHVACSCGSQVETLCMHAFEALDRLCWFEGTDYFGQFRQGGLYEMSLRHKKHFRKLNGHLGQDIKPKENLGTVYSLSHTLDFKNMFKAFTMLPGKSVKGGSEADVLCYMVVNIRRKEHPPFVLPCMGKLNKAGTAVKSFYPFLTGVQQEYAHLLTDDQKLLNEQCLALFKEAEKLPGSLFPRYEDPVDISRYTEYFAAWKKLWPLLQKQSYVFTCRISRKRELKTKPQKTLTLRTTLSAYHPKLSFRLLDKGEFFQLEMKGKLGSKTIRRHELPMLFLMQDEENTLHLLPSPLDTFIAEWMQKAGHRITVFKEHFKEFETNFLSVLRQHYEVNRIKSPAKRASLK